MPRTSREAKEDILVRSLLVCPNISEISRMMGMSRNTIRGIMETRNFKDKLARAKEEALQNAVSFLQGSLAECSSVLMNIVRDGEVSPQIKINACQTIMSQCKTWTDEIDIISRIARLEEEMTEGGG